MPIIVREFVVHRQNGVKWNLILEWHAILAIVFSQCYEHDIRSTKL